MVAMEQRLFHPALCLVLLLIGCGPGPSRQVDDLPQVQICAANFTETDPALDWSGPRPSSNPVHGIDISTWQGRIDWPTAQANGVNFAFMKATEGGDRVDPAFATNWANAAAAGVPRGAYHFFYNCGPADQQARWFIDNVPRSAAALPPVLDMEWTPRSPTCPGKRPAEQVRADARRFLTLVQSHYGRRPILYTTLDFFKENQMWTLTGVDFWLRSTSAHPSESYPGQHWTFWQYSGTGAVPGVAGKVDLNVFAGSRTDWARWLAL